MPLPRFYRLEPARQAAILAAAEAEFAARGFAAASVNAIIKAAGLSKGAMYYYFADKADLCRTVLERVLEQLAAAAGDLGAFEDAAGFWREVQALSDRGLSVVMETPEVAALGRLIYGEGSGDSVLAPLVERARAWCTEVLRAGQPVGAVREDVPLDFLGSAVIGLLSQTDRWFAEHMDSLAPAEVQRLGAVCLQMVQQIASPNPTPVSQPS